MIDKNAIWKKNLEDVQQFVRIHNRLPNIYNTDTTERALAHWRHNYVSLYNRGLLSEERAKQIEEAGIHLIDIDDQIWIENFERTKKFIELYGRYPSRHGKTAEEKKCGRWRTEQATLLRRNELTEKRKQLFVEAKLTEDILNQKWNRTLKAVVQFKKKFGRMPQMDALDLKEASLGDWCYRNSRMVEIKALENKQRASLLKAAGIPDSQIKKDPWNKRFRELTEFCSANERLPSYSGTDAEKMLYQWYFLQLSLIKKGKLKSDQITKISELKKKMLPPGKISWEKQWMEKYRRISDFVHENKRLPSTSPSRPEEAKLYTWLTDQKKRIRKGKLDQKFINYLKKIIGDEKMLLLVVSKENSDSAK